MQPTEELTSLCFVAAHDPEKETPYNGHLLIDHLSPILPIDCTYDTLLIDTNELRPPPYRYVKVTVPATIEPSRFSLQPSPSQVGRDLRMTRHVAVLDQLLRDNCQRLGFMEDEPQLLDETAIGWLELAINTRQYKNKVLQIGLSANNRKLFKKRVKLLERIFAIVGLPANQYEITTISGTPAKDDRSCFAQDVSVKWMEH